MKCKNCGYEGPHEDFMYPEEGSTMLDDSYHHKCPKCKTMIAPYGLDLSGNPIPLMDGFRCPFCEISLEKKEMQFHVGIPLCKAMALLTTKTELTEHPIKQMRVPVSKLYLQYFGKAGMRKLEAYMWERMGYNHPDENKPIDLPSFIDHSED